MRDRRWDFLYDLEKQPVRELILERFAGALAEELSAWPPPFSECVSRELLARHAAGVERKLGDDALRFALRLARLELEREFEAIDRLMESEASRAWPRPEDAAAGHLLVRFTTERCLELRDRAEGARLGRADLGEALRLVERRLLGTS